MAWRTVHILLLLLQKPGIAQMRGQEAWSTKVLTETGGLMHMHMHMSCWRAQHWIESGLVLSREPGGSVAKPSSSARTWQTCVFPVHLCLSGLQTTHPPFCLLSQLLKTRLKPARGEWHAASLVEDVPHPGSMPPPSSFSCTVRLALFFPHNHWSQGGLDKQASEEGSQFWKMNV